MTQWIKKNKILFALLMIQSFILIIAIAGYLKSKANLYSEIFLDFIVKCILL
jgi:hypothetical protein